MPTRKTYQNLSGVELSFSAIVNKTRVLISFTGENSTFSTLNEEIQKRIENRPDFNKVIKLIDQKEIKTKKENQEKGKPINTEEWAINQTSDWQEAKDFLRGEPYNVAYQIIGTPEKILAKAAELKIKFPNLTL